MMRTKYNNIFVFVAAAAHHSDYRCRWRSVHVYMRVDESVVGHTQHIPIMIITFSRTKIEGKIK